MNKILCFLTTILITCLGFSQEKIKKITEIETIVSYYSDGKRYISTKKSTVSENDSLGNKISEITKTFHLNKPYKTTQTKFMYNDKNKIEQSISYIIEDSLYYTSNYMYKNNNLININTEYTLNETHYKSQMNYEYNSKGKIISSTYSYIEKYLNEGYNLRELKAEFSFDKKERLYKSNWLNSDDTYLNNLIIHIRNNKGFIIKEKEYDVNNVLVKKTKFNYEFDDKKNWTIKRTYENRTLTNTTYREIEYFQ